MATPLVKMRGSSLRHEASGESRRGIARRQPVASPFHRVRHHGSRFTRRSPDVGSLAVHRRPVYLVMPVETTLIGTEVRYLWKCSSCLEFSLPFRDLEGAVAEGARHVNCSGRR